MTDIQAGLPGLSGGSGAWGDYDNDGDLDLALVGFENLVGFRLDLWRNNQGTFTRASVGLPSAGYSNPVWGDFDNDGDLDLAVVADDPGTQQPSTQVWRNDSGLFFLQYSCPIAMIFGTLQWLDYDGDGDLDLFFNASNAFPCRLHILRNDHGSFTYKSAGIDADQFAFADYDGDGDGDVVTVSQGVPRLWANEGGTFIDLRVSFGGIADSRFAWADYDGDGDLDLFVAGRIGAGPSAQPVTRVFRNDAGQFIDPVLTWPSLTYGGLTWGDFDNNGALDLAGVSFNAWTPNQYFGLLRFIGNGFVDSGIRLPGQSVFSSSWGDYNNDGALDLLLVGTDQGGSLATRILQNDGPILNTPPSAPKQLVASVMGASVVLSWGPSSDAQTAGPGLSYNLRIGRTPGGMEVMSPHADLASGRRRLAQAGNATHGPSTRLFLPVGTYYWSVQAVDGGFVGGPFAPESVFTISAPEAGIRTLPATGLTATGATLNGEVDPRGLETNARFEFGTTTAYGQNTAWQSLSGNGPFPVGQAISGLQIGEVYHYRVVATSAGGSVSGNDQTLTTRWFVPGPTIAPGMSVNASHAWGDYDNDGDLDLVVGTRNPNTGQTSAQLWRNDGGTFANSNLPLPAVDDTIAWGDFDRDGDLDLVFSGWTGGAYITQVWRNSNGSFADIFAGLPGSDGWVAAWGDYDSDGDLDLLLTGNALPDQPFQLWRNNGGAFVRVPTSFPALFNPQAFWGDYNGDGALDLLVMGGSFAGPVTRLYRNDHGRLIDSQQQLIGFQQGGAAWGDYDNDGDLDLAIGGGFMADDGVQYWGLHIWRNDAGLLTPVVTNLASLQDVKLAWGDFDNDGDLDLLASGIDIGFGRSRLFRNTNGAFVEVDTGLTGNGPVSWADYDNDGDLDLAMGGQLWRNEGPSFNTAPTAPGHLTAGLNGDRVVFTWTAAADAQTPAPGLTYNLRVGTGPGKSDVLAPQASLATGFRHLPELGGIQGLQGALSALKLALGTYYWSVQAIDSALAGGPFAPESSFILSSGLPLVDTGSVDSSVSSATVKASVHPRGLATTAWIDWGKTDAYGQQSGLPALSGLTAVDVTGFLSGLEPETTYHYRAAARNDAGTAYGSDQIFRTHRFGPVNVNPTLKTVSSADWADFDGDGDLDLLVCGIGPSGAVTQIWRNENGVFKDIAAGLPGAESGTVAWGDFDHDGDLDVLIAGDSWTGVWRNDGGVFTAIASALPGMSQRSAAWGDYDNDGDLDLLLAGWNGSGYVIQIWRNDSGSFVNSGTELPQLSWPHATWVDYDRDGDLDLLLIGVVVYPPSPNGARTELWSNDNGRFTKANLDFPAFGIGSAAWGDFDGDGDLDVALSFNNASTQIWRNESGCFVDTGVRLSILSNTVLAWGDFDGDGDLDLASAGNSLFGAVQEIWRNDNGTFVNIDALLTSGSSVSWADFDRDGDVDLLVGGQIWRNDGAIQNVAPSPAPGLTENVLGGRVSFTWCAASDPQTPTPGLLYNFRLQGAPGSLIAAGIPPLLSTSTSTYSVSTVTRGTNTFLDLPDGIYTWSVRAVDSVGLPGTWAPDRQVFVSLDADTDGLPDLWETGHGLDPHSSADADVDSDGDGRSNAEEFAAGTDPQDPSSALNITSIDPDGVDLLIGLATAEGKWYRLEQSLSAPGGPWITVLTDIAGSGLVLSVRVPGGNDCPKSFYRVVAQP